jgi:hypothetical protein
VAIRSSARQASGVVPTVHTLPGVRTLRSGRFRCLLAAALWLCATLVLGAALVRQAGDPRGQYAIDFADYHLAATRLAAGDSPYAPEMLAGPVDAQGQDRYRYPPLFAQALQPLASLPLGSAAAIWLTLQAGCVLAAGWLALRVPGSRIGVERVLWGGVAVTLFLPVFDTLWKGNVSGVLALAIALLLGSRGVAGAALGASIVLKLTPVAALPAALAGGRRTAVASLAPLLLLVALGAALAPDAWIDFARVLPNLLAGSADYTTNIAPWAVAERLSGAEWIGPLLRAGSIALAGALVVASVALGRRPGGWPAALTVAVVAMLLAPAALWYHYLAVLLPLALYAWRSATRRQRAMLAAGGGLVSAGVAFLPMALLGAAVMVTGTLAALWPRTGRPAVAAHSNEVLVDAAA